jgi:hypothetical protein
VIVAAITKLLSLQSGVTRTIQANDTVAASGAWTFSENAVFNAPVLFNGGATGIISENVLIKDPFTVNAADYQVDANRAAGQVFVTRGSATFSITSVASNKFLTSANPSAAFAAGDFISIANPLNPLNLGIFEVASVDSAGVTIKTSPDASVAGIVSQATTNSGAGGTLAKARLSIFQAKADGTQMEVAFGSASPLTFTKLLEDGDVAVSMQVAYDGGGATTLAGGVPVSWALSAGGNDFSVQGAGAAAFGNSSVSLTSMDIYASTQYFQAASSWQVLVGASSIQASATALTMQSDAIYLNDGVGGEIYSFDTEVSRHSKLLEHAMTGQTGAPFDPQAGYTPVVGDVVCMSDGANTIRPADADAALQSRPVGIVRLALGSGQRFVALGHGERVDCLFDAAVAASNIGKVCYLSQTPGRATMTPPDGADTHVVELGVVLLGTGSTSARILWAPRYVAAN